MQAGEARAETDARVRVVCVFSDDDDSMLCEFISVLTPDPARGRCMDLPWLHTSRTELALERESERSSDRSAGLDRPDIGAHKAFQGAFL
jgi:hypothetical protein